MWVCNVEITSLGAQIWNLVPTNLKCSKFHNKFKKTFEKWATKEYHCLLCKVYLQNLGFI